MSKNIYQIEIENKDIDISMELKKLICKDKVMINKKGEKTFK